MRRHGTAPYRAAVLHGGPGAAGEVRPLAEDLAARGISVLEPFQSEKTLAGQISELHTALSEYAPLHIIGWSWGAWLAFLTAAAHPDLAQKVILVGSGPLEEHHATTTRQNRRARLTPAERDALDRLSKTWEDATAFARSLALYQKMDSYAPDRPAFVDIAYRRDIHRSVWADASEMRRSGALIEQAARVRCPILILHGDHDPHPANGVIAPIRAVQPEAEAIVFERCGHKPWEETHARKAFLDALVAALRAPPVAAPAQS